PKMSVLSRLTLCRSTRGLMWPRRFDYRTKYARRTACLLDAGTAVASLTRFPSAPPNTRQLRSETPVGFKEASFDWALAHIQKYGDTDLFPVPFEYDAIKGLWGGDGGVRTWLLEHDPEKWTCRAHRRCVVPKHR